ncbi:putative immunity protein [Sphingopyxis kveilinensis]|uniref:putative immunity protein n=1 Tax=Sphingopyxis kveilinensis TaxID=3114367 RepID=UPI0030D34094
MADSAQSLSLSDRRLVAEWAAACADRVLWLFETVCPDDDRPRTAIVRAQAFAAGELAAAAGIRQRFGGGGIAAKSPAATAAARAAGQASAVCHMGTHALGAAAYAILAVKMEVPDRPEAAEDEMDWQRAQMSADVLAALRKLPLVGTDRSGPLGPGLLATGEVGAIIRQLQDMIAASEV